MRALSSTAPNAGERTRSAAADSERFSLPDGDAPRAEPSSRAAPPRSRDGATHQQPSQGAAQKQGSRSVSGDETTPAQGKDGEAAATDQPPETSAEGAAANGGADGSSAAGFVTADMLAVLEATAEGDAPASLEGDAATAAMAPELLAGTLSLDATAPGATPPEAAPRDPAAVAAAVVSTPGMTGQGADAAASSAGLSILSGRGEAALQPNLPASSAPPPADGRTGPTGEGPAVETALQPAADTPSPASEKAHMEAAPSAPKADAAALMAARPELPPQGTGSDAAKPGEARAPLPEPAGRPLPPSALPVEIGLRALQGLKEFQIRLDPAELGRVEVRLSIDEESTVTAKVIVDRVDTLNLLQRDAKTLERAFEQAGLKSADGGIDMTLRDPGQQRRDGQREAWDGDGAFSTRKDATGVEAETVLRRVMHRGALDLTI
jgi:flagellar hook-length control protein FliK